MGGWVDAHVAWIHFHAFTVCPWDGTSVRLASVYYLPRLGLFESPRELVQIHTAALLEHYILSASDDHLALLFHHSVSQSVNLLFQSPCGRERGACGYCDGVGVGVGVGVRAVRFVVDIWGCDGADHGREQV